MTAVRDHYGQKLSAWCEELKCILRTSALKRKPLFMSSDTSFPAGVSVLRSPELVRIQMFAISFLNNKYHSSVGNTSKTPLGGKPRLDHGVLQHVVGLPAMENGSQFFKPPRKA